MAVEAPEKVTGVVVDLHPKSGPGWSRAKLRTEDGSTVWVTGKFGLKLNEVVEAEGVFNAKFRSFDLTKLLDAGEGKVSNGVVIIKLVELLDGVGQVKARRLGEKFPELYKTLLEDPQAIADACGAALEDVTKVAAELEEGKAVLSRVTELTTQGYPHHLAKRISIDDKQYRIARESPYAAIRYVEGLGWLIADEVGHKMGIAADDTNRIDAGIDHWYREKVSGDGHTKVTLGRLLNAANLPSLLGIGKGPITERLNVVLIPVGEQEGDELYTSPGHHKNARTIAESFSFR
jgi:hypothetical protein